jgi:hypothetical protein
MPLSELKAAIDSARPQHLPQMRRMMDSTPQTARIASSVAEFSACAPSTTHVRVVGSSELDLPNRDITKGQVRAFLGEARRPFSSGC